jgi:hypothetical protein
LLWRFLLAGLAGNAELSTEKAHRLAFQQASHEPKALLKNERLAESIARTPYF